MMAGPLSAQEQLRNQSASAILAGEFDADQVLLPYQRRWIADTSQLKIAEKSRRTGLTWAEAAEAALSGSMSPEAGGTDTFYVGTTKDMAREFIDACGRRLTISRLPLLVRKRWKTTTRIFWFTSSTLPAASKSRRCHLIHRTYVACRVTSSSTKRHSRKTSLLC